MTNFERIKAMSVDELAEILEVIIEGDICLTPSEAIWCTECKFSKFCDLSQGEARKWLRKEYTEGK